MRTFTTSQLATVALTLVATASATAQPRVTLADYERAERFMTYNTTPLVSHGAVRPNWLPGDRFWYRNPTATGSEFILVDAAGGTKAPAFDHAAVAAALTTALGRPINAARFPFVQITFDDSRQHFSFDSDGKRWTCDVQGKQCASGDRRATPPNSVVSPDGKLAAFIRDYNLWVRDLAAGTDTQLTTDGVQDFGYATDNAGWIRSDRPVVLWSPDSKKVATFQQDERGVGEMYLVNTTAGHPTLQAWKYPLPGDAVITTIQRVIVEVDGPKVIRLQMPADQHRSTICDDVKCGGEWVDVQWKPDGSEVAFVSSSRNHQEAQLRVANAATGAFREVLSEKAETFFESGNGKVNWRYLPKSNEAIWFSQKDNWGHLYLHDFQTGQLKNPITSGDGNVTQLERVDEDNRVVYFDGVGREKGRDPYFRHFYRAGFDGKGAQLLTPEDADHDVSLSPSGQYFVDNYSKPDVAPTSVLRDATGRVVLQLQKADISRLLATGWKPPLPITVKDRGGVGDLYGLLYRPTNFDPSRKYPIVNRIYPGPQTGSVGSRSFSAARADSQSLAELGFVVVEIDGMGTPWRSKRFHAAYYGDMGDNTLPDQVAGMKELASRYSWIDIDRAGIYGHSGGGYATAGAMFHYPDFFKVGVSQAGNHDNRVYEDDWAEKWQGLLEKKPDGTTNYDSQANQNFAKNLKGKLLLAHGSIDNNVPFYSTLLVVDALIKANKDFDLIIFPNRGHGFGSEPYMVRRRWDYFVKHLLGAEPPAGFELKGPTATPAPTP
ncbi:MAG: DPP IV N-terminal domain-containing protein [Acidobacteriota bacterium]|nr:DPP IV N-terminal domain-containing protein [Acidobacteriota bacterium]